MDKKGITYMKIIIPVMAAIVIIGGAIVYSTKQPKAQNQPHSPPQPNPPQPNPSQPTPNQPPPNQLKPLKI